MLADEMCNAAGPGLGLAASSLGGVDLNVSAGWYSDRAAVAALYSAAELFMLTDTSPNFEDTYAFVESRVGEMSELGKTVEELAGFAAAAARGLGIPTIPVPGRKGAGTGGLPFPPLPGKEELEGLFAKVCSAVASGAGKTGGK